MGKYRTYLQEDLRTYDNPLDETISKTIFSYLKFYGYVQIRKSIRYINRTYKVLFSNGQDYAVLNFGDNIAVLTEFYGKSEITRPLAPDARQRGGTGHQPARRLHAV